MHSFADGFVNVNVNVNVLFIVEMHLATQS